MAELVPVRAPARSGEELLALFRELRKGTTLGGLTIRELIEEGRRY